jgi:hypothetical protein
VVDQLTSVALGVGALNADQIRRREETDAGVVAISTIPARLWRSTADSPMSFPVNLVLYARLPPVTCSMADSRQNASPLVLIIYCPD